MSNFIKLHYYDDNHEMFLNVDHIQEFGVYNKEYSYLYLIGEETSQQFVESPEEIMQLINNAKYGTLKIDCGGGACIKIENGEIKIENRNGVNK